MLACKLSEVPLTVVRSSNPLSFSFLLVMEVMEDIFLFLLHENMVAVRWLPLCMAILDISSHSTLS